MGKYGLHEAYDRLMSASPWAQYSGSVGLRNFAAAAQATAAALREQGAKAAVDAGDAGAAAQAQAEAHASWFEQVAQTATHTADQVDRLVTTGHEHQATAQTVMTSYEQAVARDSGPNASGMDDMNVIHHVQSGTMVLNSALDDWSGAYGGFNPPKPPPPPATGGSHTSPGSGTTAPATSGGSTDAALIGAATFHAGHPGTNLITDTTLIDHTPGGPGSVEVGTDGGEFAGWYHDPRTGYYVDPATGREFDPVTNRWIDPVTGLPFGDVTQYATGLQGLGGASTTGGLLADTTATAGTGLAGLTGVGGFAGLFSGGNTTAVAGWYGGMVPPSLSTGSAASSSLWQQASRSLAVKQEVAASLVAREQAARAGRAYLPPMQGGGMGGGAAGGRGRGRPGYLTAEEGEAELFSSRSGRRAYLPPTQAGGKDEKKKTSGERPDWLVDDDVFGADPAPSGVLGDE